MSIAETRIHTEVRTDLAAMIQHTREHAPQAIKDDLIDAYSTAARLLEKSETIYAFFLEIDTRAQTASGWRQIGYNDVRIKAIKRLCDDLAGVL